MKKLFIVLSILMLSCVFANAQSRRKKNSVARIADQVATAFAIGELKKLDSKHLVNGDLNLTIEYSGGDVEFEYKAFRSFAGLGKWLKKEESEPGIPFNVSWPLTGCRKGVCNFFRDGGIDHNHIYMTRLTYGYKNKRLYIKSVQLLYG